MPKVFVVVAAFQLSDSIIQTFISRNEQVFTNENVQLAIVKDNPNSYPQKWVHVVPYTLNYSVWSLSKVLNHGIRCICEPRRNEDIIIKTDIDIIFSNLVIKNTIDSVRPSYGLVSYCSHINPNQINSIPNIDWSNAVLDHGGKGACFAMTCKDWWEAKGYDEGLTGWGHDDTELWYRMDKRIHMSINTHYPIYHIRHGNRKRANFPNMQHVNLKKVQNNSWNSNIWGMSNPIQHLKG